MELAPLWILLLLVVFHGADQDVDDVSLETFSLSLSLSLPCSFNLCLLYFFRLLFLWFLEFRGVYGLEEGMGRWGSPHGDGLKKVAFGDASVVLEN
jgi:hypothetical protein